MMVIIMFKTIRQRWRDLHIKLERLEKRQQETDRILDVLVTNEVFVPGAEIGMNGQIGRKAIVEELFRQIAFTAVVETGTFMGQTTGFFATSFSVPVYSCELMPRYHHVARRLLRDLPHVHLYCDDARKFLADLTHKLPSDAGSVFFYLDAHWYDDLPLLEEVSLIARHWVGYVILIDDFAVPDDAGYTFDCYNKQALDLKLLSPMLERFQLVPFFPRLPSSEESGRKRGCVLLAPPSLADTAGRCRTVRRWITSQDG